jgi:hypothetical protein
MVPASCGSWGAWWLGGAGPTPAPLVACSTLPPGGQGAGGGKLLHPRPEGAGGVQHTTFAFSFCGCPLLFRSVGQLDSLAPYLGATNRMSRHADAFIATDNDASLAEYAPFLLEANTC